jgi:hypothetical protein
VTAAPMPILPVVADEVPGVARAIYAGGQGQHIVGVETGADGHQAPEGADHQSWTHRQHERKRDFGNRERVT